MTEYQKIMQGKFKPNCLKCNKNCEEKDKVLFCTEFMINPIFYYGKQK